MPKAPAKKLFELEVTKAAVKEYASWGGHPEFHLAVTGIDADGKKFWIKFPTGLVHQGDYAYMPVVAAGDFVQFIAKVKGQSDDGSMAFLSHGSDLVVADAGLNDEANDLADEAVAALKAPVAA
jgi:hypothetical protein